jgi:predicted DNA-binding WGR domain protein
MTSIFSKEINPEDIKRTLDALFAIDTKVKEEAKKTGEEPLEIRKFECKTDGHNKFYHITLFSLSYRAEWGRIGAKAQVQVKKYTHPSFARQDYSKKIAEKLGKGYSEIK